MMMFKKFTIISLLVLSSCATIPTSLTDQLGGLTDGDQLTVGTVQKEDARAVI